MESIFAKNHIFSLDNLFATAQLLLPLTIIRSEVKQQQSKDFLPDSKLITRLHKYDLEDVDGNFLQFDH